MKKTTLRKIIKPMIKKKSIFSIRKSKGNQTGIKKNIRCKSASKQRNEDD